MTNEAELLRCPFCNDSDDSNTRIQTNRFSPTMNNSQGDVLSVEIIHFCRDGHYPQLKIIAKGRDYAEAVIAWNKRAALDAKNMEGVRGESHQSETTFVHKDDNLAPSATYTHDDQIPSGNVQITVSHSDSVMRLVEAVRKSLDAINDYPQRQHPLTASEIVLKIAIAPFQRTGE